MYKTCTTPGCNKRAIVQIAGGVCVTHAALHAPKPSSTPGTADSSSVDLTGSTSTPGTGSSSTALKVNTDSFLQTKTGIMSAIAKKTETPGSSYLGKRDGKFATTVDKLPKKRVLTESNGSLVNSGFVDGLDLRKFDLHSPLGLRKYHAAFQLYFEKAYSIFSMNPNKGVRARWARIYGITRPPPSTQQLQQSQNGALNGTAPVKAQNGLSKATEIEKKAETGAKVDREGGKKEPEEPSKGDERDAKADGNSPRQAQNGKTTLTEPGLELESKSNRADDGNPMTSDRIEKSENMKPEESEPKRDNGEQTLADSRNPPEEGKAGDTEGKAEKAMDVTGNPGKKVGGKEIQPETRPEKPGVSENAENGENKQEKTQDKKVEEKPLLDDDQLFIKEMKLSRTDLTWGALSEANLEVCNLIHTKVTKLQKSDKDIAETLGALFGVSAAATISYHRHTENVKDGRGTLWYGYGEAKSSFSALRAVWRRMLRMKKAIAGLPRDLRVKLVEDLENLNDRTSLTGTLFDGEEELDQLLTDLEKTTVECVSPFKYRRVGWASDSEYMRSQLYRDCLKVSGALRQELEDFLYPWGRLS